MAKEGLKKRQGIDRLADRIVQEALDGHQWAILEIGNRLDGRPAQAVKVQGDEAAPIALKNIIEFRGGHPEDQRVIDVSPEPALVRSEAVDNNDGK